MEVRATPGCARRLRTVGSPLLVDDQLSLAAAGLLLALISAESPGAVDRAGERAGVEFDQLLDELERAGYLRRLEPGVWLISDDPAELLTAHEVTSPGTRDRDLIREGVARAKKAIADAAAARDAQNKATAANRPAPPATPRSSEDEVQRHLEQTGLFAGEFGIQRDQQGRAAMGERAQEPAPCVVCGRESDSVFDGSPVHVPCYWVSTRTSRAQGKPATAVRGEPATDIDSPEGHPS